MTGTPDVLKAIQADRLEIGLGARNASPGPGEGFGACWRRHRDGQGIEWWLLDMPDASANLVNEAMLAELGQLIAGAAANPPKGIVIRSLKRNGFIAGADVNQFRGVADPGRVTARLAEAHGIVDRLEALKTPTVAVVHGFCLGGGLEIALACQRRIALPDASFGFPEVQLGLHPGLGGTARLTHLIDPIDAMTMMLTGRRKFAKSAHAAGLVDLVTEERHVAAAVNAAVTGRLASRRRSGRALLFNLAPLRLAMVPVMRRRTAERARPGHYPAPYALIDLRKDHGGNPVAMRRKERASFGRLVTGETAQNLIRVFFLRERMKSAESRTEPVRHVHVVGAGTMGADIGAWCALKGLTVTLADMKPEALAKAAKRAGKLFDKETHSSIERRDAADRLIADLRGAGIGKADLIIEAVPENLELKRKIHAGLEARIKPGAVLATNTSSIRLEEIGTALKNPANLVGIHFFNPVAKMQLVEVIRHAASSDAAVASAARFIVDIDKLPTQVRSAPGFLVNRALMPYLLEALLLLDEKVPAETIDAAAEAFGMPMGPIELADEVGLDICLDVAQMLKQNLSQPFPDLPAWFERKVKEGELGRKSGKGFYRYVGGKAQKSHRPAQTDPAGFDTALVDRLILPLLNACAACLTENVAADADAVDGALIFGAGFAPFRGGPMHYARCRGHAEIKATLERLAGQYGPRFKPDPYWDKPDRTAEPTA
jgi:3-hydroxyacyl-CoA dehydrogenase/enoyl-CoA hydratase/3-hydroxybutyryl-CoA epimerase